MCHYSSVYLALSFSLLSSFSEMLSDSSPISVYAFSISFSVFSFCVVFVSFPEHLFINYLNLVGYRGPASKNVLLCWPPGTIQVSLKAVFEAAFDNLKVIWVGTSWSADPDTNIIGTVTC